MEKQMSELQEERSQLKESINKLELELSEKDSQLETLKLQQPQENEVRTNRLVFDCPLNRLNH